MVTNLPVISSGLRAAPGPGISFHRPVLVASDPSTLAVALPVACSRDAKAVAESNSWQVSFSDFLRSGIISLGYFCLCSSCAFGNIAVATASLSFESACCLHVLLHCPPCCLLSSISSFLHAPIRRKIREKYSIAEVFEGEDYLLTCCCLSFSLFQEYSELRHHRVLP